MSALLLLLLPVALYLLLIRPQRQRVSAQRQLLTGLATGEEVLTSGGIIGTVVSIGDSEASIEIAPGTVVRIALGAVIGRPRRPEPDTHPAPDPPQNEEA